MTVLVIVLAVALVVSWLAWAALAVNNVLLRRTLRESLAIRRSLTEQCTFLEQLAAARRDQVGR